MSAMISQWSGEKGREQLIADCKVYGPLRTEIGLKTAAALEKWALAKDRYFLESGQLMGAWRDGTMIPHDDDFDLGIYIDKKTLDETFAGSLDAVCGAMCQRFIDAGLHARCTLSYVKKVEVFLPEHGKYWLRPGIDFHNVTVDVTVFVDHPTVPGHMGSSHTRCQQVCVAFEDMWPTAPIEYCGHSWLAPRNPEAFLKSMYGYLGLGAVFDPETNLYVPKAEFEAKQSGKKAAAIAGALIEAE